MRYTIQVINEQGDIMYVENVQFDIYPNSQGPGVSYRLRDITFCKPLYKEELNLLAEEYRELIYHLLQLEKVQAILTWEEGRTGNPNGIMFKINNILLTSYYYDFQ